MDKLEEMYLEIPTIVRKNKMTFSQFCLQVKFATKDDIQNLLLFLHNRHI